MAQYSPEDADPWASRIIDKIPEDADPWDSPIIDKIPEDADPWASRIIAEIPKDADPWASRKIDEIPEVSDPWPSRIIDEIPLDANPWSSSEVDKIPEDANPWASRTVDKIPEDANPWVSRIVDEIPEDADKWASRIIDEICEEVRKSKTEAPNEGKDLVFDSDRKGEIPKEPTDYSSFAADFKTESLLQSENGVTLSLRSQVNMPNVLSDESDLISSRTSDNSSKLHTAGNVNSHSTFNPFKEMLNDIRRENANAIICENVGISETNGVCKEVRTFNYFVFCKELGEMLRANINKQVPEIKSDDKGNSSPNHMFIERNSATNGVSLEASGKLQTFSYPLTISLTCVEDTDKMTGRVSQLSEIIEEDEYQDSLTQSFHERSKELQNGTASYSNVTSKEDVKELVNPNLVIESKTHSCSTSETQIQNYSEEEGTGVGEIPERKHKLNVSLEQDRNLQYNIYPTSPKIACEVEVATERAVRAVMIYRRVCTAFENLCVRPIAIFVAENVDFLIFLFFTVLYASFMVYEKISFKNMRSLFRRILAFFDNFKRRYQLNASNSTPNNTPDDPGANEENDTGTTEEFSSEEDAYLSDSEEDAYLSDSEVNVANSVSYILPTEVKSTYLNSEQVMHGFKCIYENAELFAMPPNREQRVTAVKDHDRDRVDIVEINENFENEITENNFDMEIIASSKETKDKFHKMKEGTELNPPISRSSNEVAATAFVTEIPFSDVPCDISMILNSTLVEGLVDELRESKNEFRYSSHPNIGCWLSPLYSNVSRSISDSVLFSAGYSSERIFQCGHNSSSMSVNLSNTKSEDGDRFNSMANINEPNVLVREKIPFAEHATDEGSLGTKKNSEKQLQPLMHFDALVGSWALPAEEEVTGAKTAEYSEINNISSGNSTSTGESFVDIPTASQPSFGCQNEYPLCKEKSTDIENKVGSASSFSIFSNSEYDLLIDPKALSSKHKSLLSKISNRKNFGHIMFSIFTNWKAPKIFQRVLADRKCRKKYPKEISP